MTHPLRLLTVRMLINPWTRCQGLTQYGSVIMRLGESLMADNDGRKPHRTAQGVGLIVASVTAMAFSDAVVKLMSADLTVWQIFAARSLFAILVLIALARATRAGLRLRSPTWVVVRTALLVLTWLAYYAA